MGQNKSLDGSFEAELFFGVFGSGFEVRPNPVYGLNEEVAVLVELTGGNPNDFVMGVSFCVNQR